VVDTDGTAGATAAIFAATGCRSGSVGVTASFGLVALIAEGLVSSAIGFAGLAGFADAAVSPGRCELRRACGCGGSSGSEEAAGFSAGSVLSSASDDDSLPASGSTDGFGEPAFGAFGADELSEVESPPDGDASSAWARPLPNPTATQADNTKAATVNRNHQ
jgi:hypothetical protein